MVFIMSPRVAHAKLVRLCKQRSSSTWGQPCAVVVYWSRIDENEGNFGLGGHRGLGPDYIRSNSGS